MPRMSLSFMISRSCAVDLDLGARPLAEQNLVAGLHVERRELAAVVASARADSDDFAFLRLLLGGIGDDDPALGLFLTLETSDHDAVVQRTKAHDLFLQRPFETLVPRGDAS